MARHGMQTQGLQVELAGVAVWLLPDRALWWPDQGILVVADLHAGKAAHFRKAGIAVPASVDQGDILRLESLLIRYAPSEVVFLGDLFHSEHNASWASFTALTTSWQGCSFRLVRGNHDILAAEFYREAGIEVPGLVLDRGPFRFVHDLADGGEGGRYVLAGHLHPGIRLRGRGRQSLRLPCFCFGSQSGLLPAFGGFTGKARVAAGAGDRLYAVLPDRVLAVEVG